MLVILDLILMQLFLKLDKYFQDNPSLSNSFQDYSLNKNFKEFEEEVNKNLEKFEQKYFPAEQIKHLELIYKNDMINMKLLNEELKNYGLIIINVDFSKELAEKQVRIIYTVKVPDDLDIPNLLDGIKYIGNLDKIKLKD